MLDRKDAKKIAIDYSINILGQDLVNKYRKYSGVNESVEPSISENGASFMVYSVCLMCREMGYVEPAIDDSELWDRIVICNVYLSDGRVELVANIDNRQRKSL